MILNNNNGQYNLNFIDWENEWEDAYEAMEGDPDDYFIEGIRNGDIERMYDEGLIEDESDGEPQGVSEHTMKKFPLKQILTKKVLEARKDPCVICLDEWKMKQRVLKLPCKHEFHMHCIKQWFEGNRSCPKC